MRVERKTDFEFPPRHEPHTDVYFLRSGEIIRKEGINTYVRYQVFIRKGPSVTGGIDEAIAAIMKYSPKLAEHDGRIFALHDGVQYQPEETLMVIEGPVQDLIELETMYLSILSGRTDQENNETDPDVKKIKANVKELVNIMNKSKFGPRPISYFGARHFGYEWDAKIARAAYEGGATSTSTDIGAATFGQKGVGTVPHALVLAIASKYGEEDSAVETMKAFHKHMPKDVPRIFLADTFNREITDTLRVAEVLGDNFWGPRFDTNGAVVAEGGLPFDGRKYWTGTGVTVEAVAAARREFNDEGYPDLGIALSSGFSDPKKVEAFVLGEKKYDLKLFDFIGAGFADQRFQATSDIMGYFEGDEFITLHKTGRPYRPNPRLEKVDLSVY
ncbi:MAG: nicotinate phosphoribosyltransferase [Candidatus Freyarchaeum deiterrae]